MRHVTVGYLEIRITQISFAKIWWNTYRYEVGITENAREIGMTQSGRHLGKKRCMKMAIKRRDKYISSLDPENNVVMTIPAPGKEPPPLPPVLADVGS